MEQLIIAMTTTKEVWYTIQCPFSSFMASIGLQFKINLIMSRCGACSITVYAMLKIMLSLEWKLYQMCHTSLGLADLDLRFNVLWCWWTTILYYLWEGNTKTLVSSASSSLLCLLIQTH